MTMISPTNKEVQIGQTLKDDEYIGMVRREVLDSHLRTQAKENGATVINGLFMKMEKPKSETDPYVITYSDFGDKAKQGSKGEKKTMEVDVIVGADGANSRVAKEIDAGDYEYAIAFQKCMSERMSLQTSMLGSSQSTIMSPWALALWSTRRESRNTSRASVIALLLVLRVARSFVSRLIRFPSILAQGAPRTASA